MYDEERDKPTEVHAFNIPEDLGQIQYVFCDKTGTLTENRLLFKRAVINGVDYLCDDDELEVEDSQNSGDSAHLGTLFAFLSDFPFLCLNLTLGFKKCHSRLSDRSRIYNQCVKTP